MQSFLDASEENLEGRSMMSKITCPDGFKCTKLKGQSESVCCSSDLITASADNHEVEETTVRQPSSEFHFFRDYLNIDIDNLFPIIFTSSIFLFLS